MKRFIPLFIFITTSFAVRPVLRNADIVDKENTKDIQEIIQIEKVSERSTKEETKGKISQNHKEDRFEDADSNNINDPREDDLLKIKQLKTKFKDLMKFFSDNKDEEKKPTRKTGHKR